MFLEANLKTFFDTNIPRYELLFFFVDVLLQHSSDLDVIARLLED